MLLTGQFIISRAATSFKYPDTTYVDVVDLGTGRPIQFSTKAMSAPAFENFGRGIVQIQAEVELRQSRGGDGYYLVVSRIEVRSQEEKDKKPTA